MPEVKDALMAVVRDGVSIRKASRTHARNRFAAVTRYYNENIKPIDDAAKSEAWSSDIVKAKKLRAISDIEYKKLGSPKFLGQSYFTESQCLSMAAKLEISGQFGFPLDISGFVALCRDVYIADLEETKKIDPDFTWTEKDIPVFTKEWQRK